MAQICEPSSEACKDCTGCFAKGSLLAERHVAPLSSERSTPPVVAANQALSVKRTSFTWNPSGCVFASGRLVTAAPFLPFAAGAEAAVAAPSATYSPDFAHLFVVSSYFIKPPADSEASQPVGAA